MDPKEIALRYYSRWLGSDENILSGARRGPTLLQSPERDRTLSGYGTVYDVWALETESGAFISHSGRVKEAADDLISRSAEYHDKINELKNSHLYSYNSNGAEGVKYILKRLSEMQKQRKESK